MILRKFFSFHFYTGFLLFSLSMLWCHFHCLGVQFTLPDTVTEVHAPALPMLVACLFACLCRYYNFFDTGIAVTPFPSWAAESCHLSADDAVPLYLILFPAIGSPPELGLFSFNSQLLPLPQFLAYVYPSPFCLFIPGNSYDLK